MLIVCKRSYGCRTNSQHRKIYLNVARRISTFPFFLRSARIFFRLQGCPTNLYDSRTNLYVSCANNKINNDFRLRHMSLKRCECPVIVARLPYEFVPQTHKISQHLWAWSLYLYKIIDLATISTLQIIRSTTCRHEKFKVKNRLCGKKVSMQKSMHEKVLGEFV